MGESIFFNGQLLLLLVLALRIRLAEHVEELVAPHDHGWVGEREAAPPQPAVVADHKSRWPLDSLEAEDAALNAVQATHNGERALTLQGEKGGQVNSVTHAMQTARLEEGLRAV